VLRVLNEKGGTYVCISLLQDFLFEGLLNFFCHGTGNSHFRENILDFRIQRIEKPTTVHTDGSQSFLPFFVTIKRTVVSGDDEKVQELRKKLSDTVCYTDTVSSKAEVLSALDIKERIKTEQINHMYVPRMKDLNLGMRYEMYVFDKTVSTSNSRYNLTVLDSADTKILKKRTCAAFITPQGKERES
jgi:hypothetical protein